MGYDNDNTDLVRASALVCSSSSAGFNYLSKSNDAYNSIRLCINVDIITDVAAQIHIILGVAPQSSAI